MKKMISILTAFILAMSIHYVAFGEEAQAQSDATYVDRSTVDIIKIYESTNPDSVSPKETFEYTISKTSLSHAATGITLANMPTPTIESVTYEAGEAGSENKEKAVVVKLPQYTGIGIYTYTIKEKNNNTAGVSYFSGDIKLVVTVIQGTDGLMRIGGVHTETSGGTKSKYLTNTYSAGKLVISKEVTGDLGDTTKYFKVFVRLTGETGKTYSSDGYSVTGGSRIIDSVNSCDSDTIKVGDGKFYYIKHNETLTIENLPYGVSYSVVEDPYEEEGYDKAKYKHTDEGGGSLYTIDSSQESVKITNNKGTVIDTGIFLDNIPYIILLVIVVAGGAAFVIRRRHDTVE